MKQDSRNVNTPLAKAMNLMRLLETRCGAYDLKVYDIPIWWFVRARVFEWAVDYFSGAQTHGRFSSRLGFGVFEHVAPLSLCFRGGVFLLRSLSGMVRTAGMKCGHSRKCPVMFFTTPGVFRGTKDGRKFDVFVDPISNRICDRSITVERTTLKKWDFHSLLHRRNTIFYDWMIFLSVLRALPRYHKAPEINEWPAFESKCREVDFGGMPGEELVDGVKGSINTLSFKVLVQVKAAEMLIQAFRPSVVVEICSYDSSPMALNLAARRWGIPVMELQHGSIDGFHAEYAYFLPHDYQGERPIPHRILVWGEAFRRAILQTGNAFRPEDIVVSGHPRLSMFLKDIDKKERQCLREKIRAYLGADEDIFVVTITSGKPIASHLAAFLTEVLQTLDKNGYIFCIKLHQGELDSWRLSYKAIAQDPRIRILTHKDVDLYDLLLASDVHVTLASTVFVECLALGVPNIIIEYSSHADLVWDVVNRSEITAVNTPERFAIELNRLCEDRAHRQMVIAKGKQTAKRFFANEDYPENVIISEIANCVETD